MRIAFVSSKSKGRHSIPNGIRILSGIVLEKNLGESKIYDESFYESQEKMIRDVQSYNPDVLAVSCFADSMARTRRVLTAIKAPIKIAGGPFASIAYKELLQYCQAVFIGEAEKSFEEFLKNPKLLEKGTIQGTAIRKDNKIFGSLNPVRIDNLDEISFKGWYSIKDKLGSMKISPYWHLKDNYINILSSRGCKNNCIFCLASKMGGRTIRLRSIDNIEKEITYVDKLRSEQNLPPLESIVFDDNDFFYRDRSSLHDLFNMLKRKELTFGAFASINNATPEILAMAADYGLRSLLFGIETHEESRRRIGRDKNFSDKEAKAIMESCRQKGILTSTAYIIGFPWETKEDINRTIECMNDIPADYPGISVLDLYPGTAVWNLRAKKKGVDDNFCYMDLDSLDSRMLLPSPHPKIQREVLKRLEIEAYKRAYSPERIERTLKSLRTDFDRRKALEMFAQRRSYIQDNLNLLKEHEK